MKLYGANLSPYYERVMMMLDHKNQMDLVTPSGVPGGAMKSPEHLAITPLGKIPFLELDCGTVLVEGQVIVEYLDQVSDGAPIVPADPLLAAKASMIARVVDVYLWTAMWSLLDHYFWKNPNPEAVEAAVQKGIPQALDMLEKIIDPKDGFAVGDTWSYADFALVPVMFQFTMIQKMVDTVGFGDRPKLTQWWDAMQKTDQMQRSHGRMQKSLEMIMSRKK